MTVRVCVVGAGLAGALLAWRLAALGAAVEVVAGPWGAGAPRDATEASGGLVRAYESDPEARALATASLAELLDSAVLRRWSGFRRRGSVYLWDGAATGSPPPAHTDAAVAAIDRALPGSARRADAADLAAAGWAGLPPTAVAVLEDAAGHISPARFRAAVLADLARGRRARIVEGPLRSAVPGPASVRVVHGPGRESGDHDLVVLATGAWTPALLTALGYPAGPGGPRTKAIQFSVHRARGRRPPPFVDETTGLYGRPTPDGGMLLGVPLDEWQVDPDRVPSYPAPAAEALRLAAVRRPGLRLGPALRVTASADCYTRPAGLALRTVPGTGDRLLTFTGGSGGSAKTALAVSAAAARATLGSVAGAPTGVAAAL